MSDAKKINAKAIMTDLKVGLSDAELMQKYALSFGNLQVLFLKLVEAGLATQAYFSKRALREMEIKRKMDEPVNTCPHCDYFDEQGFTICPQCDREISEWLTTAELTDMLTGPAK